MLLASRSELSIKPITIQVCSSLYHVGNPKGVIYGLAPRSLSRIHSTIARELAEETKYRQFWEKVLILNNIYDIAGCTVEGRRWGEKQENEGCSAQRYHHAHTAHLDTLYPVSRYRIKMR